MTYVVGWKTATAAFVIADSVVTAPRAQGFSAATSTFGEKHVFTDRGGYIGEGVLKIIHLGRMAIAICGDLEICRSICALAAKLLAQGKSPRESITSAINSHHPLTPGRSVQMLAVFLIGNTKTRRRAARCTWAASATRTKI